MMRFKSLALTGLLSALAVGLPEPARAGPTSGTLYYTTFAGGENVHKVDFNYNGSSAFALSNKTGIAATPGADGLVFTSDGQLAVGGQGNAVYKVNPTTGSFTSHNAGNTSAFHMMVGPDGHIYSSGIPGTPAVYNSTLTNTGTPLRYTGGANSQVDTIIWDNTGQAWYTSSGGGGFGSFGKININLTNDTFTTNQLMTNLPAAHGGTFDSYTGDIILFGDDHITQINTAGVIVSNLAITGLSGGGTWDQGTSDGQGHIYVANNDGTLLFLDISGSGLVASANFTDRAFLDSNLDDVAPLSGLGSATPEPSSVVLLGTGGLGLLGFLRRRRKLATS